MSRLSASGPHRSSLWRRLRPRDNAATLLRGARACLALLAAAALLALAAPAPAPAQAQTEVWTATLTTGDLSSGILGCSNGVDTARCSSTSVLSEDSFNYDSTDYNITGLFVRSSGQLEFIVDADLTTTTVADLTLVVGSTSLVLSGGTAIGTVKLTFSSSGVSLTAGTDIAVKLTAPSTPNAAPTVANPIDDQTATAGTALNYAFPANTFADTDAGDTLTYTATKSDDSALPSWLGFAPLTRTFSGTPQTADVETLSVTVTASDGTESVSDTFDIVVSADTTTSVSGVLVSNIGQTDGGDWFSNREIASSFTTGGAATLTSIEIRFGSSVAAVTPTVKVFTGSVTGSNLTLGTEVAALTGPASIPIGTGNYTFTPQTSTALAASTTYYVLIQGLGSGLIGRGTDTSDNVDSSSMSGWGIPDSYYSRNSGSTGTLARQSSSGRVMFRVNGTVGGTNTAPTAADNTVTAGVGAAYTFEADHFGFADANTGDTLARVKIVTLPAAGTLALDGTPMLANAVVTKAQIDGGMLTFTPVAGASGIGYASFTFKVNDGTDDSADAYTMTIDVAELPAITIAADRPTATGKMDWIHYTLNREGDTAAELTVTVILAGPAGNDWGLDPTGSAKREVTFAADSATAEQSIRLTGSGFGQIGFSTSATMSGALTARLGATTGYDTSDTDEVVVVVTSGPAWVIKLAEDHYRFDEDGGDQDIELVATATSADMPAPSLDPSDNSVLVYSLVTHGDTALAPVDYTDFSVNPNFPSSTCSADPDADNVQVCRSNVTFTPVDDAEAEPDETLELSLSQSLGAPPSIHFQGPGPDRTVSASIKTYTVTIVDDEFGVTGVAVTSTPRLAMDTYGAREHIELSVSFNKPVTVTGAPTFTFDLGGTTTPAAYQGGSGTGTLVFSYQVMPDDTDTNGIAWAANALALAGGTIVEMGGSAAPTLTVAVQSALSDHKVNGALTAPPAITIAADRPTATGKMDWIHYTLSRECDPAAELTVTVTFAGPADNDWSLDPTGSAKREVTFAADSATAEQSILLSGGSFGIGFSTSATMSGTLTARLGAKTGYDTSDTDEVAVAVTSGPAWVIKLAEDAYSFDEDGGAQDIELVATAASADMPAPSLDRSSNSVLAVGVLTTSGTAEGGDADNPRDFLSFSATHYFPSSTCSADSDAGNVQVCRLNVTFTPEDDGEEEPDETLKLALSEATGASPAIHFQGPGPDRTVSSLPKFYPITIVDNDFRVMGAATISGAPQVGQTLTAVTTGIRDPDGLTTANYMYQWIGVDGGTEADISGANSSTYTLLAADLGKTIKVRVTFTDDASNAETRTSVATATVIAASPSTCGMPDFGSRSNIWTGALTVEAYSVSGILVAHGFDSFLSVGALAPTTFHIGLNGYTVDGVGVPAGGTFDGDLQFGLTSDLTAAEVAALRLHVCDTTYDFSAANHVASNSTYTWADDLDWSGETTLTLYLSLPPAITIAADRDKATGKIDWVHYTLNREGDTAAELTVTVTFAGSAGNDWSLDPTNKAKREVTFAADSATAEQSILLSGGSFGIGFSTSATMSGTLTARLGAKTGYDTSDTDEVAVAVTSGPAWVIKLAEDAYSFDEDGGAQDIELVATAASADMPAPSLDRSSNSVLAVGVLTTSGTAEGGDADNPRDFLSFSATHYFPSSTCSADSDAGNVQVCRLNVTFTPEDDGEEEPDETLKLALSEATGASPAIHFQGPGPDRTVSSLPKFYPITIVDNDFRVMGAATISGAPQVGQTLTAVTTGIRDPDGLTTANYMYQWIGVDGGTEADISGANSSTYTLLAADLGKTIKVRVTFTDDASNAETRTSVATATVIAASPSTCGVPDFGSRRNIWTGALTVEAYSVSGVLVAHGFDSFVSVGALAPTTFHIGLNGYTVDGVGVPAGGTFDGDLQFGLTSDLTAAEVAALRLHVCDTAYDFSAANHVASNSTYTWADDLDWSGETTLTLYLSLPANNPATGTPTITGTTTVGQELTADASPIMDIDGLTGVDFTYQWIRVDADGTSNEEDIFGEIAATYTLSDEDVGKKVKVKVSFTDELSGEEERTSAAFPSSVTVAGVTDVDEPPDAPATPAVTAVSGSTTSLTVSWAAPANAGRPDIDNYDVQYRAGTSGTWTRGPQNVTTTTTTVTGLVANTLYQARVRATNAEGNSGWSSPPGAGRTNALGVAQTGVLVSNTGQLNSGHRVVGADEYAQPFDTGNNSDGYSLTGIVLDLQAAPTGSGTLTITVREDSSGKPVRAALYTLANPALAAGLNEFLAPENAELHANTTYWVVATYSADTGGPAWYRTVRTYGLDAGAAAGWAIDAPYKIDGRVAQDGWVVHSLPRTLQIAVKGTVIGGANTPPTAADNTVATAVDTAYTFTADDFGFTDTDPGDMLASVRIVTVPTPGTLALDGTAVLADAVVTKAQIDGDMLTFTPVAGATGAPYTTFTFKVNDGTDDSVNAYTMTIDVTAFAAEPPGAPGNLRTTPGDGRMTLAWMAPANTGGAAISKYQYRAQRTGTTAWTPDWTDVPDGSDPGGSAADETRVVVSGLTNGTRYRFEVRAVNSIGEGPAATIGAAPAAGAVRRLPGAVVGLTATADKYADDRRGRHYGRVTLSWSPSAGDDNLVLVRFEHRYAEDDSVLPAEWTHGPSDRLSQTIDRLKLDTLYIFEVRAVSIGGPGPAVQRSSRTPERPAGMSLFAPRQTATEGETVTFEVRRATNTDRETFVMVGVADSAFPDIPALGGPHGSCGAGCGAGGRIVKFQPDATSATGTITVEFDGARPTSRSLTVTLASVEGPYYFFGTPTTLSIAVTDHDAGLRVRDARVREGPGAMLAFSVTLDRRRDREVMVNYATSNGTATQGEDYTHTAGTLVFSPGETSKTVSVPVLDDDHDEDSETLTLTLSNANGAVIDDATAVGTIVNSDPMPDAWLSRFGRAASDQVVESIGRRLEGGARESHLTVMGWRADTLFESSHSSRDGREPRADATGRQPEGSVRAPEGRTGGATRGFGAMSGPGAARPAFDGAMTQGFPPMQGGTLQSPARAVGASDNRWLDLLGRLFMALGPNGGEALATPGLRDMVMGSSFYYGYSPDAGTLRGMNRLTAWGESAATRFSGAEGKLSLDGEVNTAILGADGEWGRWLAGLALSYSEGEGGYRRVSAKGGAVSSTLTGINPYARYRLDERTSFWATLGYGSGRLTLTPDGAESALETDMTNAMAAFGGRGVLSMRAGKTGQFELALRSDAMLTDTASMAVAGLSAGAGATSRIRLILEGSGSLPAFGGVLAPRVEAGLRYDGGDAETGAGLEVGGGLAYDIARLTVQVDGRVLLTHRDRDYEEWGYSLSFEYQPASDGRGLRYQAGSQWGATQSGVQSLWSLQNAGGLANGARTGNGQRYTAELGYGFGVGRLWYPYVATESGGASSQALRFGLKLNAGSALEAGLEIGWRAHLSGQIENEIRLQWRARW